MADQLEYIVRNALMVCDKGAAPAFFLPTHNTHVKIQGLLVANKLDKQPLVNIPTFRHLQSYAKALRSGLYGMAEELQAADRRTRNVAVQVGDASQPRWEDTVCDQRSDSVARGCNGRHQGSARARG